jgi:hypothetical protein
MIKKESLLRDGLGWGVALWVVGYVLGFAFFPLVPSTVIGWYVMPIALAITCFVLWKWIPIDRLNYGIWVGIVWCAVAIALDYVFIVLLLNPADGYYKLDVYLYYANAFALPVLAALFRPKSHSDAR